MTFHRLHHRGRAAVEELSLDEARDVFIIAGESVRGASREELKTAYRHAALRTHPDRRPPSELEVATKEMARLNAAFEVLARAATSSGATLDDWLARAMSDTAHNIDEAVRAAASWVPEETTGASPETMKTWATAVLAQTFIRAEIRGYLPYPSMFWEHTGYFGRTEKTQTIPAGTDASALLDAVRGLIGKTAGEWRGDPARLVVRLTVQEPQGQNPGHAAIAWVAPQSWDAMLFGHRTRWHSISFHPRRAKVAAVPKADRLDRGLVEAMLRAAGLRVTNPRAWKVTKWAFPGGRWEIETGKLTFGIPGGFGEWKHYYGKATASTVAKLVEEVRPKGSGNRGRAAVDTFRPFIQSGEAAKIPIRKARTVALISSSGGGGTPELWEIMDTWVVAEGLRAVLHAIELLYESNGSPWTAGEVNWWTSQLAPETTEPKGSANKMPIEGLGRGDIEERFSFAIDCVSCSGKLVEHLNQMTRNSREISWQTFARHCNWQPVAKRLGYDRDLLLKDDWHVAFYKSHFGKLPCYYFVWSAIEQIFTPGGRLP